MIRYRQLAIFKTGLMKQWYITLIVVCLLTPAKLNFTSTSVWAKYGLKTLIT